MKTWFNIKAADGGEKETEVLIFGEIGCWGVDAASFVSDLATIPEDHAITVRINSQGGSVTEGYAIYNALKRRANVTTVVEGLAASMASVIMLAGSKIQANANSLIVIHNPLLIGATGNAEELRKMASDMDKISAQIVGIYAAATKKAEPDVRAAMDAETMFTAAEAKEWGLVHDVIADADAAGVSAVQNSIVPILTKMRAQIAAGATAASERDTLKNQTENSAAQIAALKAEADAAAAQLAAAEAANAIVSSERDSLRADIANREANDFVSAAISAGKLTEDARAQFVELFKADPAGTRKLVDALRPALGAAPVKAEAKTESGQDAEILAEYRSLNGDAKTKFYAKNKDAIWRAASAQ